jgi:hypothetical protein
MYAPFSDVFKPFGNPTVHDGLRLEDDLAFYRPSLQHAANRDADLFPDTLRDDQLIFVFDGNESHEFMWDNS